MIYAAKKLTWTWLIVLLCVTAGCVQIPPLSANIANTHIKQGDAEHGLGRFQRAVFEYDQAIQLQPNFALAYYNRGLAKLNLGQHQSAIHDFDESLRIQPDYSDAYYGRGLAKFNLGLYQEAVISLTQALSVSTKPCPRCRHMGERSTSA